MIQIKLFTENSGASGLAGGMIHEGVTVKPLEDGDKYYDLIFTKDGSSINKRLFDPSEAPKFDNETQEEATLRAENENASHLLTIMKLVDGQEFIDSLNDMTYENFIKLYKARESMYQNVLFNLKVGYATKLLKEGKKIGQIGRYPNSYLELHVEGKPSKLKWSSWEEKTFFPKEDSNEDPVV